MRQSELLPRDLRITARWLATIALLLAGCLNPRPEELPSAQGLDGAGDPGLGDGNENAGPAPRPAPQAPANPGSVDIGEEEPNQTPTDIPDPVIEADGGTTRADAGPPDAGD